MTNNRKHSDNGILGNIFYYNNITKKSHGYTCMGAVIPWDQHRMCDLLLTGILLCGIWMIFVEDLVFMLIGDIHVYFVFL